MHRHFVSSTTALLVLAFFALPAVADRPRQVEAEDHDFEHQIDLEDLERLGALGEEIGEHISRAFENFEIEIDTDEFERLGELGEEIGEQIGRAFEDLEIDIDMDFECDDDECHSTSLNSHHVRVDVAEAVESAMEVARIALENFDDIHIEVNEEKLAMHLEQVEKQLEELEEQLERKFDRQ